MSNRADRGEDGETGLMREANKLSLDILFRCSTLPGTKSYYVVCVCWGGGGE